MDRLNMTPFVQSSSLSAAFPYKHKAAMFLLLLLKCCTSVVPLMHKELWERVGSFRKLRIVCDTDTV